jgi:prepilin-type N-terminal cleavage/methylation domain-containing protein
LVGRIAVRRAFSLLEVMVSIAVMGLVAALLFPVFSRAKQSAKETAVVENLRQWHHALTIYRTTHDGDAVYGTVQQMGLPDAEQWAWTAVGQPKAMLKSPCGRHPNLGWNDLRWDLNYGQAMDPDRWVERVHLYRENHYLVADMNCTDSTVYIPNQYEKKRGFAVLLGGRLSRQHKTWIHLDPAWWAEVPP